MEQQIKKYFQRYIDLDDFEFEKICSMIELKVYEPKEHLLSQGQICRFKYFVLSGLVRAYYVDNNGKERITQFAIENWWLTNVESFVKDVPSTLSYQAIEKTILFRIKKEHLENLYNSIPKLEKFFRIITENMLIAIQRRNDFYIQMSSRERYFNLIQSFPDFAQRVPQYMVASYLNITPEHLSTIRKA